ncbi:uncharacterized protein MELLADRAFT_103037 [Melampsora larici-populina 98AG31]|uniref:DUF7143 domain-containing protein n=1 Tax=Melampsora larici-populina (strain 98AG31 / pathotype 3-4-7) TaxID=747676 RepID=F4RAC4_MELLP|nr:uncharacterized protein MELLADRAFT_103037 [Melampsora larici-populina 98AG31]EGG10806.1 hypothetical protein MELLADRAFT_103037 [Melampsora larici-populina 98AG31]
MIKIATSSAKGIIPGPDKPCYVAGNYSIPQSSRLNPDIECVEGPQAFPPIPDLKYQGTTYSSIDYHQSDKSWVPVPFALQNLSPSKNLPKDTALDKLSIYMTLYGSMIVGLRSIGPRAPKGAISQMKALIEFLSLNVAVVQQDIPRVKTQLASVLSKCPNCSVKDKYDVIMFASSTGIDPEKFFLELEGSGCNSRAKCADLQKAESNRIKSKNSAVLSTFLLSSGAPSCRFNFDHSKYFFVFMIPILALVV